MILFRTSFLAIPLGGFLGLIQGALSAFFVGIYAVPIAIIVSLLGSIAAMLFLSKSIKYFFERTLPYGNGKYWLKTVLLAFKLFLVIGMSVFFAINISAILGIFVAPMPWDINTFLAHVTVNFPVSLVVAIIYSLWATNILLCSVVYFSMGKALKRFSVKPAIFSVIFSLPILIPLSKLFGMGFFYGAIFAGLLLGFLCAFDIHKFLAAPNGDAAQAKQT